MARMETDIELAKGAYVDGRIDLGEFERDVEMILRGETPGQWLSRWSTEEPAGPVNWFEPKYREYGMGMTAEWR